MRIRRATQGRYTARICSSPATPNEAPVKILATNLGHDGAVALIEDAKLVFSLEAEKDSNHRYAALSNLDVIQGIGELDGIPDAICVSGWWARDHEEFLNGSSVNAGYLGVADANAIIGSRRFLKRDVRYFSSTHERAHILCAFGMSPIPKGTPCYALVWEGSIGAFYELDSDLKITKLGEPLTSPGNRYALLYGLADPSFPKDGPFPRPSDAGKLMALASFSTRVVPTLEESNLLRFLLSGPYRRLSDYDGLSIAPHLNAGLEDPEFRNFAGIYSDAIFDTFLNYARANLREKRPLIISGGCGLNCDWNTKWRNSGCFTDVFVPPVANDSGAAIGTAIDAQLRFTGEPKIAWDVYSGLGFRMDSFLPPERYATFAVNVVEVADLLASGLILGWVSGRYEIGPRALGNRSILAAPFKRSTTTRLNQIKRRESFRPIAPVCLSEDSKMLFGCDRESPHMLYTYRVATDALEAITHANGSARVQTVTAESNRPLYELLLAFKARTGYGVLCNTSLNFNGKGAINGLSDLDKYASENDLDGFVVEGLAYLSRSSRGSMSYLAGASRP